MAAFAVPLIKPLLDLALAGATAGTVAKATKDVAKKIKEEKHIKDTAKALNDKEKPNYKSLSRAEKDEILITLAEGGLSTREIIEVLKTGHISDDQLKRIPVELRRKISRMTGQDLEAQLGLGGPEGNGDDDDDKDKKNEEKKEKLRKLKKDAEDEQREWKKKETEFQKNDPKTKRMSDAKKGLEKARSEAPSRINKKDPKFSGNTPEQKMQQGEARMKRAIENGTGPQWEYLHVTPMSNPPIFP